MQSCEKQRMSTEISTVSDPIHSKVMKILLPSFGRSDFHLLRLFFSMSRMIYCWWEKCVAWIFFAWCGQWPQNTVLVCATLLGFKRKSKSQKTQAKELNSVKRKHTNWTNSKFDFRKIDVRQQIKWKENWAKRKTSDKRWSKSGSIRKRLTI